ncbi:hypothetical protein BDW02DRAFT_607906 [Decorospora gaudefroyi]|uniref:Uncharacterized protein n=1 Tax=Decorospora gaudefroyi TaxID=184978 RepID=A0A6A5KNW9_9PLEO|nr:hypothetical protein BDW02DRAFT_607906 [Decorospora gaudefroyi]
MSMYCWRWGGEGAYSRIRVRVREASSSGLCIVPYEAVCIVLETDIGLCEAYRAVRDIECDMCCLLRGRVLAVPRLGRATEGVSCVCQCDEALSPVNVSIRKRVSGACGSFCPPGAGGCICLLEAELHFGAPQTISKTTTQTGRLLLHGERQTPWLLGKLRRAVNLTALGHVSPSLPPDHTGLKAHSVTLVYAGRRQMGAARHGGRGHHEVRENSNFESSLEEDPAERSSPIQTICDLVKSAERFPPHRQPNHTFYTSLNSTARDRSNHTKVIENIAAIPSSQLLHYHPPFLRAAAYGPVGPQPPSRYTIARILFQTRPKQAEHCEDRRICEEALGQRGGITICPRAQKGVN